VPAFAFLTWTPRLAAEISLFGMALELVGGLYLAYDLLGGRNGPLQSIARATGYLPLFFAGYIWPLGLPFALIASTGMASILAIEFHLAVDGRPSQALRICFGLLRGLVLGVAALPAFGPLFASIYGGLTGLGLGLVNVKGFAPADDYQPRTGAQLRTHNLLASAFRGGMALVAAGIAGLIGAPDRALHDALRIGLTIGAVSAFVGLFSPSIEARILHAPEKRLGMMGLGFILLGTALESLEKWMVLFGVSEH